MIEYHKCRVSSFSNWASIPVQKSIVARVVAALVCEATRHGAQRAEAAVADATLGAVRARWHAPAGADATGLNQSPSAIYLVFAQGKAASPEKLKHEAAVAALTAQIQLIELEASQRDPLF